LLEPGEELRFAFRVETKRSPRTLILYGLARGGINTLGTVYAVITDRALLLVDLREDFVTRDRKLYADLPLPRTLGPVTPNGWITLDGQRAYVPGGRKVIERAEVVLQGRP
jgi:hypothetical protein